MSLRIAVRITLALLICLFIWGVHWAFTCWGQKGGFRYRSFGTFLDVGWGHNSSLMWLDKGQRITFRYRSSIEGEGAARFYVVTYNGPRPRPHASVDVQGTGVGALMFTAQERGLYGLSYVSRDPWKGEIQMSWQITPR